MRFIIENPDYDWIDHIIHTLRASKTLQAIGMKNVRRDAQWVTTQHMDVHRVDGRIGQGVAQEYMLVIAFDLPWRDEVLPVLTNLFEGSGLIIASLDDPSLRFQFG